VRSIKPYSKKKKITAMKDKTILRSIFIFLAFYSWIAWLSVKAGLFGLFLIGLATFSGWAILYSFFQARKF